MKTASIGPHIVTEAQLQAFCQQQHERHQAYLDRNGFTNDVHKVEHQYTIGPRYARITCRSLNRTSNYVVCFIDMTNGDILKGSWKSPVKNGVRGNIFKEDGGASVMTEYGVKSLR